ncbi:MAG TPA: hypothetical protein VJ729_07640 [Nitrososphaeraceae archaeon]|nr:hypothetical protein [Nitrososphaeraceae archaeon]
MACSNPDAPHEGIICPPTSFGPGGNVVTGPTQSNGKPVDISGSSSGKGGPIGNPTDPQSSNGCQSGESPVISGASFIQPDTYSMNLFANSKIIYAVDNIEHDNDIHV